MPIKAYLLEPQALFVPFLTALLLDHGIVVDRVRAELDLADVIAANAPLLFIDADFVEGDLSEVISIMRTLVGEAIICVYAEIEDPQERTALIVAGADCVIPKSADEKEFGAMLLPVLAQQR